MSMASEIASSSLTGRPPISGISPSRPGRWPMVRWNAASAIRTCVSACTRSARAPSRRASACETSVMVSSPTRKRSRVASNCWISTRTLLRRASAMAMFCTRSAYDVDGRQQHVLLGVGKCRALGLDVGLRRLGLRDGLAAAEDRLGHRQGRELAVQDEEGRRRPDRIRILLDLVVLERKRDPRPPVGDGLGERFVGLPQDRPAGQQVGIAVVRGRQGLDQALRPGIRSGPQPGRDDARCCCAREPQAGPDTHSRTLICGR